MGCIVTAARYMANEGMAWRPHIRDAFEVSQRSDLLEHLISSSPVQGEPSWLSWNVQELDAQACRDAAAQARYEADWQEYKAVAIGVAGALVSAVFYAILCAIVGAILFVAENFFIQPVETFILENLNAGFFILWLIGGSAIMTPALFLLFAYVLNIAPRIWTKELLPAIHRSHNYAQHLYAEAAILDQRAELLEAGGQEADPESPDLQLLFTR